MPFTGTTGFGTLATTGATTIPLSVTGVSVGDLVFVWAKWEGGTASPTCSDGTSTLTPWAPGVISRPSADPRGCGFFILSSVASGSLTYTVSLGVSRTFREIVAYRTTPSGLVALDGTALGANGSSTAVSSGNITTTGTDGIAFGTYGDFGNSESAEKINGLAATGNTHAGANASEVWYRAYSAGFTGAATCSLGISNDWLGGIIAFSIGGGGGGASVTYPQLERMTRGLHRGINLGMAH